MPTISGVNLDVNFWGVPENLEKQGRKNCGNKSLEKFTGNFLKIAGPNLKIHPNSALENLRSTFCEISQRNPTFRWSPIRSTPVGSPEKQEQDCKNQR